MSLYDNFKVSAFPCDIVTGNVQTNLDRVSGALANVAEGTDLVVLPELFSTGYIDNPSLAAQLAEPLDGATMHTVASLAAAHNCAIAGSFLAKDDDKLYNRAFLCEPRGDVTCYDKHHLFCLSEESKIVTHGTKNIPVVRFRGWNIALAICYDVRFPVWCRNSGNMYDLLVIPANWPRKRAYAWEHLLAARAIENQAYVVGANRSGSDSYGDYDSETFIFDFMGKSIGSESDGMVSATLSKTDLEALRRAFPVWKDADRFRILT